MQENCIAHAMRQPLRAKFCYSFLPPTARESTHSLKKIYANRFENLSFSQVQQPIKAEAIPCLTASHFPDQQLMSQLKVLQALHLSLMEGIIWTHTTSSVMKGRIQKHIYDLMTKS
mgnify:CR=1 FL=1